LSQNAQSRTGAGLEWTRRNPTCADESGTVGRVGAWKASLNGPRLSQCPQALEVNLGIRVCRDRDRWPSRSAMCFKSAASGVQPRREGAAKTMGSRPTGGKSTTAIKRLASRFAPHWWKLAVQFGNDGQQTGGRNQSAAASNIGPQCLREMRRKSSCRPGLSWWLVTDRIRFSQSISESRNRTTSMERRAKSTHAQCHRIVRHPPPVLR